MSLPEAKALPDPPTDGVSALEYLSNTQLASTSWDGCARIHNTGEEEEWSLKLCHAMESGPLLSLTSTSETSIFTGGLDGSIRQLDVPTSKISVIGRHSGEPSKIACSCLKRLIDDKDDNHDDGGHLLVSAGWHSQLQIWDIRTSAAVATLDLPGKAFSMDVHKNRMVVATSAGRRLVFIDYRYGKAKVVLDRESSLKYQTRTVQFFPNGQGYALGSIEGRVAVEYLPPELQKESTATTSISKNYAFKCHRIQDTVYPVNAIVFCPSQDCSFATGGCDGTVVIWDGQHKKKLTTLPRMATSIAALAFTPNGKQLAIAASYTFEEGEKDHPRDDIFVRSILDSEVQPKANP